MDDNKKITHPAPLPTIYKLIQERYPEAKAVFWAGSVSQGNGTSASDLDLIIVFETIPFAYREAFIYDGWPIDAFIHDLNTLHYFFEESRTGNGISGLSYMILNGKLVTEANHFSENIEILAQQSLNNGPVSWDKQQIDKERFLITDVLDDIKHPANRDEQIASAAWLLEALGQFYFRAQNKWCASGKSIIRYLKNDNPPLATEFTMAFDSLFKASDSVLLELLVQKILAPYGGLLWDGFRSDAPAHFKKMPPKTFGILTDKNKKDYPIVLEETDNTQAAADILAGVRAYNITYLGLYHRKHFVFSLQDENKQTIAGLTGEYLETLCTVHLVWIKEELRGLHIGTELLLKLEEYIKPKGCTTIQLDTTEFQAKPFYEKLGYVVVATLPKGFKGHVQWVMRKEI